MSDANEEHLNHLKDGVASFNRWRGTGLTGPYAVPYLVGADLSGLDLSGVNLSRAHLGQVNLSNANLRTADLNNAKLGAANLRGADLRSANLMKTYFGGAVLDGVDLTGALYDATTIWPTGFDPQAHGAKSGGVTKPSANLIQADHYIVRKLPPEPADANRLIDDVLAANGYTRGTATVDFKVDPVAANAAYPQFVDSGIERWQELAVSCERRP